MPITRASNGARFYVPDEADQTPCPHCGEALGATKHAGTVGGMTLDENGVGTSHKLRGMNEAMVLNRIAGLCPACEKDPKKKP